MVYLDAKEVLKETLLEQCTKLWQLESTLIRMEASAREKGVGIRTDESYYESYCHILGARDTCRDMIVKLKSKLGNSELSLLFNSLKVT